MAKVPHGVKTLPKISIARVGCTNVTDDRQTDGQTMTYSLRSLIKRPKEYIVRYHNSQRLNVDAQFK